MADLVERLLALEPKEANEVSEVMLAAADEIQRLRKEVAQSDVVRDALREEVNYLVDVEMEMAKLRARIEAAPVGVVEESGWNDDGYDKSGRVYGIPSDLVGKSVRLVVEE